MTRLITRRRILTGLGIGTSAVALSGLTGTASEVPPPRSILSTGEWLSHHVHRAIVGDALAPEFTEAEISPNFRTNGTSNPQSPAYRALARNNFADWRLSVEGLVEQPRQYSLEQLRQMPSRTQITLHDCVEGWSAIGKWTGVPLARVLEDVRLLPSARYIVFHCADSFASGPYYESIDLREAAHPQTILAYGMNDGPLSIGHGAPVRLRVERQLGYKQAKYVMRIEAVATLADTFGGLGGYWEDVAGYDWYAGI